jgi:hypothetical protein
MADAPASGAGVRKGVGVQVPPRALEIPCIAGDFFASGGGLPGGWDDSLAPFVCRLLEPLLTRAAVTIGAADAASAVDAASADDSVM